MESEGGFFSTLIMLYAMRLPPLDLIRLDLAVLRYKQCGSLPLDLSRFCRLLFRLLRLEDRYLRSVTTEQRSLLESSTERAELSRSIGGMRVPMGQNPVPYSKEVVYGDET